MGMTTIAPSSLHILGYHVVGREMINCICQSGKSYQRRFFPGLHVRFKYLAVSPRR